MTVYFDKTKKRWRYTFMREGARHQGDCRDASGALVVSKREAKIAEAVRVRQIEAAPRLPDASALTLSNVALALTPAWLRQKRAPAIQARVKELLTFFGPSTPIADIGEARIAEYIDFALAQPIMIWRGGPNLKAADPANAHLWAASARTRAPATVNLYLEHLRQMFARAAKTRDPITGAPALAFAPDVPKLKTPKRKARPTPDAAIDIIFREAPPHVADAVILALCFGFRRGEVLSLQIRHIDWEARGVRLYAEDVKDAEDTFLPASAFAMGQLERLAAQARARAVPWLITYRESPRAPWRPVRNPKRAWARVMDAVEAELGQRWKFHALRAAFITRVAMGAGGVPAQAMARHSDFETTQGYIEVADSIRREAAEAATDRPALRRYADREKLREQKRR